jgi:hypothetical protein
LGHSLRLAATLVIIDVTTMMTTASASPMTVAIARPGQDFHPIMKTPSRVPVAVLQG